MKMRAVAAELPSRTVTNADILSMIEKHSAEGFDGDLDGTLEQIDYLLRYSGSESRQWLDDPERPIDLLHKAADRALAEAELTGDDIDLLIYTGIGRGFIEPGGAYHSAAAIGLPNAHCFDLIDACMSWARATHLVNSLFQTGEYRTAMIVNAEFNLRAGGAVFPDVFELSSAAALEWTFPAFTLGEAASATIFTAEDNAPWSFRFVSRPDLAEMCNVTLHGYEGYCVPSDKLAKNGIGNFTSYGSELHRSGRPEALKVFRQLDVPGGDVAALFTHASSKRYWQTLADEVGLGASIHHVFQKTGNIVSASVPTAIASAISTGQLKSGDRAVGWVGSAGMSFGAFSFVY